MAAAASDIRALQQVGSQLRDGAVYSVQNLVPHINMKDGAYIGIYFDTVIEDVIAHSHLTLLNTSHCARRPLSDNKRSELVEALKLLVTESPFQLALFEPSVATNKRGHQRVLCVPHAQQRLSRQCWAMRSSFLQNFGLGKDCEFRLNFHISLDSIAAVTPPPPPPPALVAPSALTVTVASFAVTQPQSPPPVLVLVAPSAVTESPSPRGWWLVDTVSDPEVSDPEEPPPPSWPRSGSSEVRQTLA